MIVIHRLSYELLFNPHLVISPAFYAAIILVTEASRSGGSFRRLSLVLVLVMLVQVYDASRKSVARARGVGLADLRLN